MDNKEKSSYSEHESGCSRRGFLGTVVGSLLAAGISGEALAEEKKASGRPARVNPERKCYIVPFGAQSLANFHRRCVGCQLCVSSCPNRVLNVKASHKVIDAKYGLLNLEQPAMSFENGYCRPECVKCSQVCPAGAIEKISADEKSAISIGHAVVVTQNCLSAQGDKCGHCAEMCPVGAVSMVTDPATGFEIPSVDENRCLGCGKCEYLCPSRPLSAIYVEGREQHINV